MSPVFAFFEKMSLLLGRSEYPGKNWRQRIAFSARRAELVRGCEARRARIVLGDVVNQVRFLERQDSCPISM